LERKVFGLLNMVQISPQVFETGKSGILQQHQLKFDKLAFAGMKLFFNQFFMGTSDQRPWTLGCWG